MYCLTKASVVSRDFCSHVNYVLTVIESNHRPAKGAGKLSREALADLFGKEMLPLIVNDLLARGPPSPRLPSHAINYRFMPCLGQLLEEAFRMDECSYADYSY